MAVIAVTNTLDNGNGTKAKEGSLRAAIAAAKPGDTIKFDASLANQTIDIKRRYNIGKDITLDASEAPGLKINGGNKHIIFQLDSAGSEFTLRGLTLINAHHPDYNGAAIRGRANDLKITVEDSEFRDNYAGMGAAIYAKENADVTVLNSQFYDNRSDRPNDAAAGAISVFDKSKLVVKDSEFVGNSGVSGGAVGTIFTELTIENSVFRDNQSERWSGAVHADGVTIPQQEQYYKGNRPRESEGGNIVIRNSQFENNQSGGRGGAVGVWGYDQDFVLLEGNTFIGNKAIRREGIQGDNATAKGGALRVSGKQVTLKDSLFENNTSDDEGGAVWTQGESPMTITNTFFLNNRARKGGAIYNTQWAGPGTTIENSTFQDNRAFEGGAIYRNNARPMTITGSLFENNGSNAIGGALKRLERGPDGAGATLISAPEEGAVLSMQAPELSEVSGELPPSPELPTTAESELSLEQSEQLLEGVTDPIISLTLGDIDSLIGYLNSDGFDNRLDPTGTAIDPLTNQPISPGEAGYGILSLSQPMTDLYFDSDDNQLTSVIKDDRLLAFVRNESGIVEAFLTPSTANHKTDNGLNIDFALGSINPNHKAHIKAMEESFGFEALYERGDNNFGGLTFTVDVNAG